MSPRQISPRHMPDITLPSSYDDLNSQWTTIRTTHHRAEPSIVVLTLYRPGKHNAFTDTMRREIESAYAMFDIDPKVKCVVVTGDGRIFCAGADLEIGFGEGLGGESAERVQDHRDGYVCSFSLTAATCACTTAPIHDRPNAERFARSGVLRV